MSNNKSFQCFIQQDKDENRTLVLEFWLVGFESLYKCNMIFFFLFLMNYIGTVFANIMILLLASTSHQMYSPMYFFLCHLSLSDLLVTTTIVPQMLFIVLRNGCSVPLSKCFAQFYFFAQSTITECLLLTVMSYDRYLAICNPLRYSCIMNFNCCLQLVMLSWVSGMTFPLTTVLQLDQMKFCGSNTIDHFFCDLAPILKLSCSDTSVVEIGNIVFSIPIVFCPLFYITITYVFIFHTIFSIPSTTGRQKAFSTCSSHLTVVCTYYGTLVINYVVPSKGQALGLQKIASILYTMLIPLFNPVIYSLRNKEVKGALRRHILKMKLRNL